MEILLGTRHRHLSQPHCSWPQVCLSDRLLQWKTLEAHFFSGHSCLVFQGIIVGTGLSACRQVAELLVHKQHSYHRKLINARQPDPRIYSIGDVVFARHAVKSDDARGNDDKLQYAFTGPWRISAILPGATYELEHYDQLSKKEKRHASDLSPYPTEWSHFNLLTVPTLGTGRFTNQSRLTPLKRLA
jgi:hypothetical protein